MTLRPRAVAAIAVAAGLIGAAYLSVPLTGGTPAWAPWTFVAGVDLMLVALMVLGAARPGRGVGRLALPFALTALLVGAGFGLLLLLPPAGPAGPSGTADPALVLGLPPRAALVIYGIGLVPVLVLPLAYALTFGAFTLDEADLRRIRAARRERDSAPAGG